MNEQTKALLREYLTKLLRAIETGADFAAQQIPLVIQEKLSFDFWMAVVWLIILILIGVGVNVITWGLSEGQRGLDKTMPRVMVGIFSALFGLLLGSVFIETILKIYLAPRLYIIEWLRGMI